MPGTWVVALVPMHPKTWNVLCMATLFLPCEIVLELDLILENALCMESPDLGGGDQMGMRNLKY